MVEVNPQFVRQGLLSRGLPAHIADGFVMNIADESGFNAGINELRPTVPGSRGGFGLYQLTGPRRVAFEEFAQSRGVNPSDPDAQLDFLMTELQGPESRAAQSIFSTQDAPSAAVAIARDFLRPAPENLQRRVARYTGGMTPEQSVAMDTRDALGYGARTGASQMEPINGQPAQQPGGLRGLLSDPDLLDRLAIGFGGLTLNPNTALMQMSSDRIAGRAQTRQDTAAKNKTIEFLRSQPNGEQFVQLVDAIGPVAALRQYQDQQSGSALPSGIRELTVQAQLAGLQPGTPEYQEFMLAGGGDPATFRALDRQARAAGFEPGTPEYQEFMATRGAGLAEGAVLGARTEQGGAAAGAVAAGGEMVTRAFDAFDQASLATGAIGTMDEAIAAIDRGARSGLVENFLPNVTEASAALNNAMNRMGLDVISSVTFGALSEAEMNLAMETAAPRNLEPEALREWLVNKRNAQEKARDALFAAARYFSRPGNTLEGWLDQQGNNRPASGAETNAPAATPSNVIRYDAQGNRIE